MTKSYTIKDAPEESFNNLMDGVNDIIYRQTLVAKLNSLQADINAVIVDLALLNVEVVNDYYTYNKFECSSPVMVLNLTPKQIL